MEGGGISSEHEKLRKLRAYREWRKQVFGRDGYKCRVCGEKGYVQAHHILTFSQHKDLRHKISNGITLCVPCHKFVHKKENLFVPFFQWILKKTVNSGEVLARYGEDNPEPSSRGQKVLEKVQRIGVESQQ